MINYNHDNYNTLYSDKLGGGHFGRDKTLGRGKVYITKIKKSHCECSHPYMLSYIAISCLLQILLARNGGGCQRILP